MILRKELPNALRDMLSHLLLVQTSDGFYQNHDYIRTDTAYQPGSLTGAGTSEDRQSSCSTTKSENRTPMFQKALGSFCRDSILKKKGLLFGSSENAGVQLVPADGGNYTDQSGVTWCRLYLNIDQHNE